MKSIPRLLLIALPLATALTTTEAVARSPQYAGTQGRHARAAFERYPLGARDFYYQFAESRGLTPATETGVALGGAASMELANRIDVFAGSLALNANAGPTTQAAGLRTGMVTGSRAEDSGAEAAPMSAPRPPASNLALPIAALGLMLFVARRRSVP